MNLFCFFSVIITTYNRSVLLKRALDSLIAQTETDWEAIIVDNGSTDNTATLIKPTWEMEAGSNTGINKMQDMLCQRIPEFFVKRKIFYFFGF